MIVYIIVDKKTGEKSEVLINDWLFVPMFIKKKYALQFKKEKWDNKDLKVVKFELNEK